MTGRRERNGAGEGTGSGSFVYYFGQLFFVPLRTLIYSMEILLDAIRGVQRVSDRGVHLVTGSGAESPGGAQEALADPVASGSEDLDRKDAAGGAEIVCKETEFMDKDLNDDMLKLVRYKILFVKRDFEHAFDEEEELISDNMDGAGYTAWKVAQFIQLLGDKETRVPKKWGGYPEHYRQGHVLTGLPEDDKKYLRVFYEVLERYPREKLKYEEDQLKVLREISRNILDAKKPDGAGHGAPSVNIG